MPLPVSDSLSLSGAVQFVMEKTGEIEARVYAALTEAGLTGALTATGCLHLSALSDPAKYFDHPALSERMPVPPGNWGLPISWQKSRIGRYDLVRLNRADIERWLAAAPANGNKQPPAASPSPRPKKAKKETKADAVAALLREHFPDRPAMTVDELKRVIEQQRTDIGQFSPRTLRRAIAIAWPKSA